MKKRGFVLVFFLIVLFCIMSSFAQESGCCIDKTNNVICEDRTDADCAGDFYSGNCANNPQCIPLCKVCTSLADPLVSPKRIWGPLAEECLPFTNLAYSGPDPDQTHQTQITCENATGSVTQTLPEVSGKVTDNVGPVQGARVNCLGATAVTNSNGVYILSGCFRTTTAITAEKDNEKGSLTVDLTGNAAKFENKNIIISGLQTTTLIVNVKKGTQTIGQADVTVTGSDGLFKQGQTSSSGSISFVNVPIGQIIITVSKIGYSSNSTTFDLSPQHAVANIGLSTAATSTLSGTVMDKATQSAISGASIEVFHYDSNGNKIRDAITTSSLTGYTLTVAQGTYLFEARKTGYNVYSTQVVLDADKTENIQLEKPVAGTSILTVNVQNELGNSVSGAYVQLLSTPDLSKSFYTDSSGSAVVELQNGPYALIVDHEDFDRFYGGQIDLAADRTITITLSTIKKIWISGTVKDKTSGIPILKATVSVANQGYVETNIAGMFSIQTKASDNPITVFVRAPNYILNTALVPPKQKTDFNAGSISLTRSQCSAVTDVGGSDAVKLTLNQVKDTVNLEWSSLCAAEEFVITRSKKTPTAEPYVPLAVADSNTLVYTDDTVDENTKYCYVVTAKYLIDNQLTYASSADDGKNCVDVGPEICFDGDKTFCDTGNVKRTCVGGKIVEPSEQCQICVQRTSRAAECVAASDCNECNRPFGVFSLPATYSGVAFFGGKGFTFKNNFLTPFFCSDIAIACFKDYSRTVSDKFYSCNGINSCYDYVSQDSCDQKKCTPSLDCEWIESDYSELGVGVCRPRDETKQDCKEFNTPRNPKTNILNKVFSNEPLLIAKQTCSLYRADNSCYYREKDGLCLNKEETSCYDYADKLDCLGPNDGSIANTVEKTVVVNVTWFKSPQAIHSLPKRINGDNSILIKSNDYFNKGLCKFDSGCIRDADNNQNFKNDIMADDCPGRLSSCALDITPPITNLNYRQFVKSIDFDYEIIDDSIIKDPLNQNFITTWFNVVSPGGSIYPSTSTGTTDGKIKDINKPEGEWELYYFSEDYSHNLEPVKKVTVTVDRTPPNMTFSRETIPNMTINPSEVTLITSLKSENEDAICNETKLTVYEDGAQVPIASEYTSIGSTPKRAWYERFDSIPIGADGKVAKYEWACFDKAGNKAQFSSSEFTLDADDLISDPEPSHAVRFRNDIAISITTKFNGQCKFNADKITPYSQWYNFSDPVQIENGRYKHTATTNLIGLQYQEIYVACRLDTVQGLIYGTKADNIKITIDEFPPTTYPFDEDDNPILSGFNTPHWTNSRALKIGCVDEKQNVPDGFPKESGCGRAYYCIGAGCSPVEDQDNSAIEIVELGNENVVQLGYSSVDVLGNRESNKIKEIRIDDIPPTIELIEPNSITIANGIITRNSRLALRAAIHNIGEPASRSPLKQGATQYKVYATNVFNRSIPLSDLEAADVTLIEDIILEPNKENRIVLETEDLAGNKASSDPIVVIQDSLGPDLISATYESRSKFGTQLLNAVDYGTDLEMQISNLMDIYPDLSVNLRNRVDSVWAEDMFGAKYKFEKDIGGNWIGTIRTASWFVTSPAFKTFITIFANDSIGNIAEFEKNITIVDNTPPSASFKLENAYGEQVSSVIKGTNYLILTASESLDKLNLSFKIGTISYPVIFIAKDFEAITWVGYFDIDVQPQGSASVIGSMTDLNGLNSSEFYPYAVAANPVPFSEPLANVAVPSAGMLAAASRTRYANNDQVSFSIQSQHKYQFTVNNVVKSVSGESQALMSGFKPGMNPVTIREEDEENNFKIYSQNIFVDMEKPEITNYPSGTLKTANEVRVDFVDEGNSGINNQSTSMMVQDKIKRASTPETTSLGLVSGDLAPDGQAPYSGIAIVVDNAGNSVQQDFAFRINSTAPIISISGLTKINAVYLTKESNPQVTLSVANLGQDAVISITLTDSNGGITSIEPASGIITGPITARDFIIPLDLPDDGKYVLSIRDSANSWYFEIFKDTQKPIIELTAEDKSSGKPLVVEIKVINEQFPLSSAKITAGGQTTEMTQIASNRYLFSGNVASEGSLPISVTVKDALGQESEAATKTISIDNTISSIPGLFYVGNLKNVSEVLTSNQQNITIQGTLTGISNVFVIGDDGKKYQGTLTITGFEISGIKLVGRTYMETTNDLTVVVEDDAGNRNEKQITIVKDLRPPQLKTLLFAKTIR